MKKNIKVRPYLENSRQIREGLNDKSWVAFSLSTDKKLELVYFNEFINPEEFDNFSDFAQAMKDDFYCNGDNVSYFENSTENLFSYYGVNSYIDEDFINDKKIEFASVNSSILKVYNGGISFLNIFDKAKDIKNELISLEKSEIEIATDSNKSYKDPYSYFGATKKHI